MTIHRTLLQVEVFSDGPLGLDTLDLSQVHYAITDGDAANKAWGQLDTDAVTKYFAVIPLINDQFVFAHGSNIQGAVVNTTFTGYYDIANLSVKH